MCTFCWILHFCGRRRALIYDYIESFDLVSDLRFCLNWLAMSDKYFLLRWQAYQRTGGVIELFGYTNCRFVVCVTHASLGNRYDKMILFHSILCTGVDVTPRQLAGLFLPNPTQNHQVWVIHIIMILETHNFDAHRTAITSFFLWIVIRFSTNLETWSPIVPPPRCPVTTAVA